jgi:predicted DNA-binding transcriptional regulator AlpA
MFTVWFATGAVLLFVPFPALPEMDRVVRSQQIDFGAIKIPPATIGDRFQQTIDRLRIIQAGPNPVYVVEQIGGSVIAISAQSGKELDSIASDTAREIAERFARKPAGRVDGPFDYDQWIVHQQFDPERPFFRVAIDDRDKTELYVSARTGEVLQRTMFRNRAWNSVGAVIHWIYPTILRKNWMAWNQVVWWLALAGVVTATAGMVLGIVRAMNFRRRGKPGLTPFRGALRWHHLLGLSAGVFLVSWIFSGWLSMDHGRIFSKGEPNQSNVERFRGIPLPAAVRAVSIQTLQNCGPASEIEIVAVAGRSFVVARGAGINRPLIYALSPGNSAPFSSFPKEIVLSAVQSGWPDRRIDDVSAVDPADVYTGTDSLPATAIRFVLNDPAQSWVHVDLAAGRIVSVMDSSRRAYAWLYYGLHTFSFPVFANHPILRRTVMLIFLSAGFALSLSGVVVGFRRIGKALPFFRSPVRSRRAVSSDSGSYRPSAW